MTDIARGINYPPNTRDVFVYWKNDSVMANRWRLLPLQTINLQVAMQVDSEQCLFDPDQLLQLLNVHLRESRQIKKLCITI
jgi:hypothetical protein